jgi:hypothetical protein
MASERYFGCDMLKLYSTLVFTVEYRHTRNLTMIHSTCIMGGISSELLTKMLAERY